MARLISRDQARVLIEYFSASIGGLPDRSGWFHGHTTALQIACEALARLGAAEETDWGAVPLDKPSEPLPLRWDDASVAVLWLAEQNGEIRFNPSRRPNILPAQGAGAAHAEDGVREILWMMGVVYGHRWSTGAETMMWRAAPWNGSFEQDPRFIAAVENAIAELPSAVENEIARARKQFSGRPVADILFRDQVDRLVFRGWRLDDGWLTKEGRAAALEIFHDPVGMAVSAKIVRALGLG